MPIIITANDTTYGKEELDRLNNDPTAVFIEKKGGYTYKNDAGEEVVVSHYVFEKHHGMVLRVDTKYHYDDDRPYYNALIAIPNDSKFGFEFKSVYCEGYSKPDASDAIHSAYIKMKHYERRKSDVQNKLRHRNNLKESAKKLGVKNMHIAAKLYQAVGERYFNHLTTLVESSINGRLRSPFKISIATQVKGWLASVESGTPIKRTPLSARQLECIIPSRRY